MCVCAWYDIIPIKPHEIPIKSPRGSHPAQAPPPRLLHSSTAPAAVVSRTRGGPRTTCASSSRSAAGTLCWSIPIRSKNWWTQKSGPPGLTKGWAFSRLDQEWRFEQKRIQNHIWRSDPTTTGGSAAKIGTGKAVLGGYQMKQSPKMTAGGWQNEGNT